MTASTITLTPETTSNTVSGAGATAETPTINPPLIWPGTGEPMHPADAAAMAKARKMPLGAFIRAWRAGPQWLPPMSADKRFSKPSLDRVPQKQREAFQHQIARADLRLMEMANDEATLKAICGNGPSETRDILKRAARGDYEQWQRHIASAAACSHPVRLSGWLDVVDSGGEVIATRHTSSMPDGVIYKACGNRRASICPACAETYRADAYQLIKSGITGGKGVPDHVRNHPALFATFTAPSFGDVHTHRLNRKTGKVNPCRWRKNADICPHGVDLRCATRHGKGDKITGTPLCLDCYDYEKHVVWHTFASSELWRQTLQKATRLLRKKVGVKGLKISYAKVAEYQARGAIHYHAILRFDGHDPDEPTLVLPPPPGATAALLREALEEATDVTKYCTPVHPVTGDSWVIGWGDQLDFRTLHTGIPGDIEITAEQVAGYIAKYATKSTEASGRVTRRLTTDTVGNYADLSGDHTARLIAVAWNLGNVPQDEKPDGTPVNNPYKALRRSAHHYGYGGHFLTKSRKYSATFRTLRTVRRDFKRNSVNPAADGYITEMTAEQTHIIGTLHYAASGWKTPGDAQLANSAAARAREWKDLAKTEPH